LNFNVSLEKWYKNIKNLLDIFHQNQVAVTSPRHISGREKEDESILSISFYYWY